MKKILILILILPPLLWRGAGGEVFAQKQGQEKIDSLFFIFKNTKTDTIKVNVLNDLAFEFRNNVPDSAIYFANEAMVLATQLNYKMGIADAFLYSGMALTNLGEFEEAVKKSTSALKLYAQLLLSVQIATKSEILIQKASAYNTIGVINYLQGNYQEALKNILDALKIRNEINDKNGIAASYNNIGNVYESQGNYPEALKNYFASLKVKEEIKDRQGIANSYGNIGNIYYYQENYSKALNYQFDALKIEKEIGDKRGIAYSYGNIGTIYDDLGNFQEALKYQLESLKIEKEIEDQNGIADSYTNIGSIYYEQSNYSEALKNFLACLKISEEIGDKLSIVISYINIGKIYIEEKKNIDASHYLNKSLSLAKEIGSLNDVKESYGLLAKLDSAQGNFKQSLQHYKMYITYRDSMFNEENTKKLVQSQMQYEFDKKEAATKAETDKKAILAQAEITRQKLNRNYTAGGFSILLLGSGLFAFLFNQKRKSQFKNQVSEVEMKALRSQMNPHFIFNSLNSIDDYVQHHDIDNSSLYINKFARLMRKILENSRLEQVPLQDDLEVLELYIQMENLRMKNKVAYSVNISPEVNAEQVLIQPLLLQPFVENAFKHAFAGIEQPTLEINITQKGDMIHCEVKDNGKGRGSKQEVVLETKEHRESLGLKVTQERLNIFNKIKKTKAYIAFEDMKDANFNAIGTRVEVAVPASYVF